MDSLWSEKNILGCLKRTFKFARVPILWTSLKYLPTGKYYSKFVWVFTKYKLFLINKKDVKIKPSSGQAIFWTGILNFPKQQLIPPIISKGIVRFYWGRVPKRCLRLGYTLQTSTTRSWAFRFKTNDGPKVSEQPVLTPAGLIRD